MLHITSRSEKKSVLKVSGSALIVTEGRVGPQDLHEIHKSQFRFGFGDGTMSDREHLGEAIMIESKPNVSWMENKEVRTESRAPFSSPFFVGIDSHQELHSYIQYKASAPISLHSVYDKLARQFSEGFFLVGYALASELHSTFMKKPPIFNENIVSKRGDYWSKTLIEKAQKIVFMSVVLTSESKRKFPKALLERVFYETSHPEEASIFLSHTHAALLGSGSYVLPKETHAFFEAIKNESIDSVRHILNQTMILEGAFMLFPIDQIQSVEKPVEPPKERPETLRRPFYTQST